MSKFIPEVANARFVHGVKWFKYPIDVVNHENKLESLPHMQFGPDSRLTCGHCKRFETREHIMEHHENMDRQMRLF